MSVGVTTDQKQTSLLEWVKAIMKFNPPRWSSKRINSS